MIQTRQSQPLLSRCHLPFRHRPAACLALACSGPVPCFMSQLIRWAVCASPRHPRTDPTLLDTSRSMNVSRKFFIFQSAEDEKLCFVCLENYREALVVHDDAERTTHEVALHC